MTDAESYRVYAVRVFVTDWERALAFYTDTLGMTVSYRSDDFGWAELDTGAARLALVRTATDDPEDAALVGRFVGVSLQVPDIAATHLRLAARGVTFTRPPTREPWGGTLAELEDPDGNVLTLLGWSET